MGLIFTIIENGIPGWEFTNWNSLAKVAANPIVETWGSEQSFDLIALDNHLHLPPSVYMSPTAPPPIPDQRGYLFKIFGMVITPSSKFRPTFNTTCVLATIVMILVVACLGATIYLLHLKKQAEIKYFINLVQFMKQEAATGA